MPINFVYYSTLIEIFQNEKKSASDTQPSCRNEIILIKKKVPGSEVYTSKF